MNSRQFAIFIWSMIALTTLPFLLLYTELNFDLISATASQFQRDNFWYKFWFITGNTAGFIGASLMVWQFVLGVRQFAGLFSKDVILANKIHSLLGKFGVIFVLAHPLIVAYNYVKPYLWIFTWDFSTEAEKHISFGRTALILFLVVYITSAILRSKLKYRPWLYIHYLSYPLMLFVFLHGLEIGTYLNKFPLLYALWLTLLGLYLIFMIYRFALYSGVLSPRYILTEKYNQTEDLILLKFEPATQKNSDKKASKSFPIVPKAGEYAYIQTKSFGESHPFSVLEFVPETGSLIFGIKQLGRYTKSLSKLEVGSQVGIDGSYGVFGVPFASLQKKVIISGGIGITPFVEMIKQYATTDTYFFNCNRNLSEIVAKQILIQKLGNRYYDFISGEGQNLLNSSSTASGITNQNELKSTTSNSSNYLLSYNQNSTSNLNNMYYGRLTIEHIQKILGEGYLETNYFICGSPFFIKAMRNSLKSSGVPKKQIFVEEFGL